MSIYRPDKYEHTTIYYPIVDANDSEGGFFVVDALTDLETYPAHKLRVGQLGIAAGTIYICNSIESGALLDPAGWVGDTSTWSVFSGGTSYWTRYAATGIVGTNTATDKVVIGNYGTLSTYTPTSVISN